MYPSTQTFHTLPLTFLSPRPLPSSLSSRHPPPHPLTYLPGKDVSIDQERKLGHRKRSDEASKLVSTGGQMSRRPLVGTCVNGPTRCTTVFRVLSSETRVERNGLRYSGAVEDLLVAGWWWVRGRSEGLTGTCLYVCVQKCVRTCVCSCVVRVCTCMFLYAHVHVLFHTGVCANVNGCVKCIVIRTCVAHVHGSLCLYP